MKQLLLDIQPAPAPSLQNFVAAGNTEAVHALRRQAAGDADFRFICLWGPPGSGKSHLLQAVAAAAGAQHISSMLIKAPASLEPLPTAALVAVDDVQRLAPEQQIALFNLYNRQRDNPSGALLTSGEAAPMQLGLRDDLATRLSWGLVYQLHPLSDEEKAQALRAHAAERGMKLPDEAVEYCLRHLRRDLPTLMATLDALDEWSLTAKKPVTVPMLRKLLQLPLGS